MSETDQQLDRQEEGGPDPGAGTATGPAGGPSWLGPKWAVRLAACLIVLATLAAYANSFQGVFLGDDETVDRRQPHDSPSLADLGSALPAPQRRDGQRPAAVEPHLRRQLRPGRPESLGLSCRQPGDPHPRRPDALRHPAANVRVWRGVGCGARGEETHDVAPFDSPHAHTSAPHTFLAFAIALLWAVHPLQTESVTYIVQRAESLCGLFYLLTLYCFIRGASRGRDWGLGIRDWDQPRAPDSNPQSLIPNPFLWYAAAVLCCFLGMATKEVMVTAPLVVLLYDRTFLAGSFVHGVRAAKWLYRSLAAGWVLLGRPGDLHRPDRQSAGTSSMAVSPSDYAATSRRCAALLWLSVWPDPLCLDYGRAARGVRPQSHVCTSRLPLGSFSRARFGECTEAVVGAFLARGGCLDLGARRAWCPLSDACLDHRMYLPLAAVLSALGLAVSSGCLR